MTRALLCVVTLFCAMSACTAQEIITTDQTVPVVIPGQTIKMPEHTHDEYALADHLHPIAREIPTAKELSEPGALDEYVNRRTKEGLAAILPSGVIYTDRPVTPMRAHGCRIIGAGPAWAPTKVPPPYQVSGWRSHPNAKQVNTTIVSTDPTRPVFDFSLAIHVQLSQLSIETPGVGVAYYQRERGWGPLHLSLAKVVFFNCSEGVLAGKDFLDHTAADATFTGCVWNNCKKGVVVNHQQGVNWVFDGLCYWYFCDDAVVLNAGGGAKLYSPGGYGVKRWLTVNQAGHNLGRSVIQDLRSDRRPTDPMPVIVDCVANADVMVDGIDVIWNGEKIPDDYEPFIGKGAKGIDIRSAAVVKLVAAVRAKQ